MSTLPALQNHGDGTLCCGQSPKPNRAFPGSIASPSAVAHVIEEKYVMGVPLYRQEQQWSRRGVNLSRQNMANWIMHAQHWLQPIYDRMKEKLLAQGIIYADENNPKYSRRTAKKPDPSHTCGCTVQGVMALGLCFSSTSPPVPEHRKSS